MLWQILDGVNVGVGQFTALVLGLVVAGLERKLSVLRVSKNNVIWSSHLVPVT